MATMSFTEAAHQVLIAAGAPLSVAEIWQAIERDRLVASAGKTPQQTLAAELLRSCKGVVVAKASKDRRFFRAGPGRYGLLEWLPEDDVRALELEEALSKPPPVREAKGDAARKQRAERRVMRRADPDRARIVMERRCGTDEVRAACAAALVEVVRVAHERNPAGWNLSLIGGTIRVNVGVCLTLGLRAPGVWISVLDNQLGEKGRTLLSQHATRGTTFKVVPGSTAYHVPPVRFAEVWEGVRDACLAFTRAAATTVQQTPHYASHSPGVTAYLRGAVGEPVPDPSYLLDRAGPQPSTLEALFEEFVTEYLDDERGKRHLSRYEEVRREGRAHFERIRARKQAGEDITDDVLLHLFPHSDTKGNRDRKAWIHIAPAVTKDLKTWYEGAKRARAEDWPRIAEAVWTLVERCERDPDRLAETCEEFSQHDFIKGIQSGLLSPILNAVRPDRFHIINTKSLRTLNHFHGSDCGYKLVEYPEANEALQKLIEEHRETLVFEEEPDASPFDLFDVFSHWFVAIRKVVPPVEEEDDDDGAEVDIDVLGDEEDGVEEKEDGEAKPGAVQPVYTREMFLEETGFSAAQLEDWLRILQRKRQVVLQGPPGTGKTYVAERLAKVLVSGRDGLRELVQFHPAYAYEDFMRGIRPRVVGGGLSYEWEDGRFVEFCADAARRSGPSVLVIDEINRANLARVFGELMYLLEYRDRRIPLAGGDGEFFIPDNVFVIGTMNTADRSIARLDHALRRRFSFVRLRPDYEILEKHLERHELPARSLVEALRSVNRLIADPNYEVGISYFMRPSPDLRDHLPDIWRHEIETYLEEYFYDQPGKVAEHRWEALVEDRLAGWAEGRGA